MRSEKFTKIKILIFPTYFIGYVMGVFYMPVLKKVKVEFEDLSEEELKEIRKRLIEMINGEAEVVAEIVRDDANKKKIIIHR